MEGNYENHNKATKKYREKMFEKMAFLIDEDDKNAVANLKATTGSVYVFEEMLINYKLFGQKQEESEDSHDSEELTIEELQEKYPYWDWLYYINNVILPNGFQVTENEPVMNWNIKFFENLGTILKLTSNRTLTNYILWRAVNMVDKIKRYESGWCETQILI